MEQEILIGGIVPATHDGRSNAAGRQIPDHIPHIKHASRVSKTSHTVQYETFANTGDAKPPQTIIKGTGPFMSAVDLTIIFWGSEWTTTTPPPPVDPIALETAIRSICSGPYLEAAYRYANFGSVTLKQVIATTALTPPASFTNNNVFSLFNSLFLSNTLAPPAPITFPTTGDASPTNFYVVLMPSTSTFNPATINGMHFYFDWTNANIPNPPPTTRVYAAWVANNGTLDSMTTIFSHELVEAYTDPEGTYIQLSPASSSSWNEVADVCRSAAFLDGVLVQSYWSAEQNACVIPYYNDGEVHDNPASGLSLQVIAIRKAYSRAQKRSIIQKIKAKNTANGDVFQLFVIDAIVAIETGKNSFFVVGAGDGSRANVLVKQVHGHGVLSTVADSSLEDNLLSLPAF